MDSVTVEAAPSDRVVGATSVVAVTVVPSLSLIGTPVEFVKEMEVLVDNDNAPSTTDIVPFSLGNVPEVFVNVILVKLPVPPNSALLLTMKVNSESACLKRSEAVADDLVTVAWVVASAFPEMAYM